MSASPKLFSGGLNDILATAAAATEDWTGKISSATALSSSAAKAPRAPAMPTPGKIAPKRNRPPAMRPSHRAFLLYFLSSCSFETVGSTGK